MNKEEVAEVLTVLAKGEESGLRLRIEVIVFELIINLCLSSPLSEPNMHVKVEDHICNVRS